MTRTDYIVISNRRIENATYVKDPSELEALLKLTASYGTGPKTLIFAFWSWIVPTWILEAYKCYGLHTGPLLEGKGKGGSPIDNLQALGVDITTLCSFEMNEKIDGGRVILAIPIYICKPKEEIIKDIDQNFLPAITDYITTEQPEIPEYFRRIK